MPFYTPLRYPGGKRRLAAVIKRLLEENNLRDINYVETYAGGSAVALALLFEEYASTIHINDLSRSVFAFWHTVLHNTRELCDRIKNVNITMSEWRRQRAVYDNRESAELVDLGFATLFLNRTNRSGIIGGGVIGGKSQSGEWGLDARFNKDELIQRIRRVSRYKNRVHLYMVDALRFTKEVLPTVGTNTFVFYDPPYIENGQGLYLNEYDINGHRKLAERISKLKIPWIVTYDSAAVTAGLFRKHRRVVYGLSYSAQNRYHGKEVMFVSDGLQLPKDWTKTKPFVLSKPGSEYPVYGILQNAPRARVAAR